MIGRHNLPQDGQCILCCNHISFNDPLVMIGMTKRKLSFIAKKELFKSKIVAWVLHRMTAIPIDRGAADVGAFRAAMATLKGGGCLGVYVTGHRMKDFDDGAVKAGSALFAHKSGAPVIPVGFKSRYLPFTRIIINIGEPVDLSEYLGKRASSDDLNAMALKITARIKELII